MRVVFAGGGTGGHLYPALALARYMVKQDTNAQIIFYGREKGLESRILPQEGFELKILNFKSPARKLSINMGKSLFMLSKSTYQAAKYLRKFSPHVVIGTGGYISVPVVLAAIILRIPTILHEQNVIPGKANKLLSPLVSLNCLSFSESAKFFPKKAKLKVTGNPRASEAILASAEEGYKLLGMSPANKNILIVGGSQGAERVNNVMIDTLKLLAGKEDIHVIYVTGQRYFEEVSAALTSQRFATNPVLNVVPYIEDMPAVLAAIDLIVSRAGATTLAEINALGLPSILIPSPNVTDDHQTANARVLERSKAAVLLSEKELDPERLAKEIFTIVNNDEHRQKMAKASLSLGHPQSAAVMYEALKKIITSPDE